MTLHLLGRVRLGHKPVDAVGNVHLLVVCSSVGGAGDDLKQGSGRRDGGRAAVNMLGAAVATEGTVGCASHSFSTCARARTGIIDGGIRRRPRVFLLNANTMIPATMTTAITLHNALITGRLFAPARSEILTSTGG